MDGARGMDGSDGEDGVSVTNAFIDFDGSLVINLSDGQSLNVGEVVAPDLAEKIKVITNGGGTSQGVLDTLTSLQNQINLISSALVYKGTWNASTNTPALASGVGTANSFYIVSVAGTTTLDGISNWGAGDWATFNGTAWQRVEGGAAGNFTDISVSGSATLSGGTANGVAYLNGSKVLTTGTALTFDGTNLGVGTSSPATRFELSGNNTGSTSDTPVATIRLSDTDASTAADQPIGKIEFYGNDITVPSQNVMAYILSKAAGTSGGGDLRFGTCPDTGAFERMRLDSSGNLGLGVTPSAWAILKGLQLPAGSISGYAGGGGNNQFHLLNNAYYGSGTGWTYVTTDTAQRYTTISGQHQWFNAPSGTAGTSITFTQAMTLDASGRLLLGTTSARTAGGITPALQVESTTVNGGSQYLTVNNATAANSPILQLNRSRGTAVGDVTAVASGDTLGRVFFAGADGTGLISAASISAAVDGTPGTNDMPGRLVFSTTADGASSPTERMRLDSSGNLGLGVTPSAWSGYTAFQNKFVSLASAVNVVGFLSGNAYYDGTWKYIGTGASCQYAINNSGQHQWFNAPSGTAGAAITFTQAMTLDASGNLGVGTTSPVAKLDVYANVSGANTVLIRNDNTSTADYATQSYLRLDVAGNQIGGLKTTARNLGGLSSPALFLTTIGPYPIAFGINNSATPSMLLDASGNLGIGTTSPSASAILDAQSTSKGVRMPNMTTTQKNAIASPAAGLMVYDTTLAKLCVYTTAWETITSV
jgi:hypothetical protein